MIPDLVVIGAGSAGITAARNAVSLGATVMLVERDKPGGDCLWTGCVPSKALLAAARAAHAVRTAGRFGVRALDPPKVDFAAVLDYVRGVQREIEPVDSADGLAAAGIKVVTGTARFTGRRELMVDGEAMRFRTALVATGSAPLLPDLPGLDEAPVLTSDTVWEMEKLPSRLVVLGGGAIGCEFGQAFGRLGCDVTVVEVEERLLPTEEPAVSRVLADVLLAEGVRVLTGATPLRWSDGELVIRSSDGVEESLPGDALLVAVGRRPRTDELGLDAAGVHTDPGGHLAVDTRLRTSNRRIYAAGDVTGAPPFTHVAVAHGAVAAHNAVLGPWRTAPTDALPWVVFTDPEVARVGLTVAAARELPGHLKVRRVSAAHVDRAVAEGRSEGFSVLVGDRRGRLVGATVVSPHAGESITELGAVLQRSGRLRDIADLVHPYPTFAEGPWLAATQQRRAELGRPRGRRLVAAARWAYDLWLRVRWPGNR